MSNGRWIRAAAVAALGAAAIAGCGGGSKPAASTVSALDPASAVPASAVLFASASVKPEGTLKQDLVRAFDAFGGANATTTVINKLTKSLNSNDSADWNQIKAWLGQRVGVALIGLPPAQQQLTAQSLLNYALIVLPTSHPSEASSYLSSKLTGNSPLTYKVSGHYALIGGQYAVQMATGLSSSRSLADLSSFQTLTSRVGTGAFATFYARSASFDRFITTTISGEQSTSAATITEMKQALRKLPANATTMLTLNATANTLRVESSELDAKAPGAPASTPGNVAGLPAGSWAALAIHADGAQSSAIKDFESGLNQVNTADGGASSAASGPLKFLSDDVLPALGPLTLSVSGQTKASARVGITLAPASQSAGDKLLSAVKSMLGKKAAGLKLGHDGNQLVAIYGYKSFGQLLTPKSTLASNPVFKQALSQLPQGSTASLFFNFAPIAALSSSSDHNPKDAKVVAAVSRMSYLIAGSTKTSFELVLGFK